jgi:hypothetical protein
LTNLTEYGEIVTGSTLDELGRHWFNNSVVEDGTRVIVTAYIVTVATVEKAVTLKGEKGAVTLKGEKGAITLKGNKGDVKLD